MLLKVGIILLAFLTPKQQKNEVRNRLITLENEKLSSPKIEISQNRPFITKYSRLLPDLFLNYCFKLPLKKIN